MGSNNPSEQWWDWWVTAEPVAVATWAGTGLSAIGLIISMVGLLAAFMEARAAKIEAHNAANAIGRLKTSLGASSLAYAHSQVGMLFQFVEGKHFEPAQVLLATVQREMLHHASDIQATDNTVIDLKTRLNTVSVHIGYAQAQSEKFNSAKLRKALTSVQHTIIDWENAIRRKAGEGPR